MSRFQRIKIKRLIILQSVCALAGLSGACMASSDNEKAVPASYDAGEAAEGDDYWNDDNDMDYDQAEGDDDEDDGSSLPPETEKQAKYRVPQGAGKYVFIPDEEQDTVIIVDSQALSVKTVEVGSKPSHLVTLNIPGIIAAAVININSDDVSIMRVSDAAEVETIHVPVRPDTNALAPSPDGRFVIAYHDPLFTADTGVPSTDQEITVISTAQGAETVVNLSVGQHPWKVVYSNDNTKAFVVSEGGIDIIDLNTVASNPETAFVRIFEPGSYNSTNDDIEITPDGALAIGRKTELEGLQVAWLDGSGEERFYEMESVPTDLKIAKDGSFGVAVLREENQVAFFDLPLPASAEDEAFTYRELPDIIAGVSTLSADGKRILLYTTSAEEDEDLRRLTLMNWSDALDDWEIHTALLERPIDTIFTVDRPDGSSERAVVMHQRVNASSNDKAYAYTLVKLPDLKLKLQKLTYEPEPPLLTPDGDYGLFLLTRTRNFDPYDAEKVDLNTLIVDPLKFSSPTIAAGYAQETDTFFVAQDHNDGRITFVGAHHEGFHTITGYKLSEEVEVSP